MSKLVFLDGKLRLMNNNKTVVLTFYCNRILEHCLKVDTTASAIFNDSMTEARIKPTKAPTRLYSDGRYAICLAVTKYLPSKIVTPTNRYKKVKVTIDPSDFGLHKEDLIEDYDGRLLFDELKNYGFEQHPIIPTCNNRIGDLLVLREGKPYSFHITRYNPKADTHDKKLKLRYYLLGRMAFQCFQAIKRLDAICIAIMHSDLHSKRVITTDAIGFFASNRIQVIFTDFKENWQGRITNQILELTTEKQL
jgi:hypothetical protein